MTYRLALLAAGLALPALAATPAHAACTIDTPSTPSTASFGQLQFPFDRNGDGQFDTLSGSGVQTYDDGASGVFDRQGTGRIVMRVPTDGLVTSPHSSYPRTELKENRNWDMGEGCAALAARVTVYDLPANGTIVIGQIHIDETEPRPPVELYYNKGAIYARILYHHTNEPNQPRYTVNVVDKIAVKQPFSYSMTLDSNALLTLKVATSSGTTTKTTYLDSSFYGRRLHFKAGNYTQDKGGGSSVGFDGLAVQHN